MTHISFDESVAKLAKNLEAEIRTAFGALGGFKLTKLSAGKAVDANDDFDVIVSSLSEHFAKRLMDAVVIGQNDAKTAAAGAVSRMAAPAAPTVMQANTEDLAWDAWMNDTFGTARKYDAETGQRIQQVRIVP